MKAKKVLDMLGISRRTLTNYVKNNKIKVRQLENGFYDYDDIDVERIDRESVVHGNKIIIISNGNKFEYNLDKDKIATIKRIIDVI